MNTRANRKVQSEIPNVTGRHAVVLGGSLAELLAARILAETEGKRHEDSNGNYR
jgi:hypothetical protein